MTQSYVHHVISTEPRQWQAVADTLRVTGAARIQKQGGSLFGVWRSQIGRPRDELTAITVWEGGAPNQGALVEETAHIKHAVHAIMVPTLRPSSSDAPRRQGNYAFRSFETPAENWDEFLDLCAGAWPGFESSYDSQVIGLWRFTEDDGAIRRSLLLTRRPNLAMWERSKIPDGDAETEVRRKLSRRYDLCDATGVYTTTLLTADDAQDTVRWT
jgi:hypothetical protein